MKKISLALLVLITTLTAKADSWTQKADFAGGARYVAVGFSIGNKGYIGTGYGTAYMQDFWEYDAAANTWTQKANFPGAARYFACGFAAGSKGYIGLGQTPSGYLQDFWAFDTATNSWAQIANFPGGARGFQPTAFSVDGYGYVGLGFDGVDRTDLWQYDTLANTWTQKAYFTGTGMEQSCSFTIGSKAYIGTGETSMPMFPHKDFWEYDPATDSWTQLTDFPGLARHSASAFSIGQWGYIGTGYDSANVQHTDFYQYDPSANSWTQKADFGGTQRSHALGFSIGTKGYIGTGYAGGFLGDFWEYTPDATVINELPSSTFNFEVYPNPASEYTVISWQFAQSNSSFGGSTIKEEIEIVVTDVSGKEVFKRSLSSLQRSVKVPLGDLRAGMYMYDVRSGSGVIKKGKIVKQ